VVNLARASRLATATIQAANEEKVIRFLWCRGWAIGRGAASAAFPFAD
jgi:hypothetical protein